MEFWSACGAILIVRFADAISQLSTLHSFSVVVVLDVQPLVALAHELVLGPVDDAVGEKAVELLEILLDRKSVV